MIIWEFHIMHTDPIHFPVLVTFSTPQKRKTKKKIPIPKKKNTKSILYYPYTHRSMVKLLVSRFLKKTTSFPTPTISGFINCEELPFSTAITVFKS